MLEIIEGMSQHLETRNYSTLTSVPDDEALKDMCPICKTDKYLSPNMTFLINPECYHKICESCVDRIFSLGPAPCPYPKCGKILRKNKFKQQIFEDLRIEREIDIRKKVGNVYNKTQEDFPELKQYNQYLENIEEIVFKLNNGVDVEQTQADLDQYEQEHKLEILEKNMRESEKSADLVKYQEAMERLKQEKRKIQEKMDLEDLNFQREQQQKLLDKMATSEETTEEILKQLEVQKQSRLTSRRKQLQTINDNLDRQFNPLLHNKIENKVTTPFTPFRGDRDLNKRYTMLPVPQDTEEIMDIDNNLQSNSSYYDPYMNKLAKVKEFLGSGWRLNNVYERALDEAFIGLGCIIEQEKSLEKHQHTAFV
ncbi:RNA polymerase II transcription factor B subunit 3 [Spathaspora sp. JA1]|nr:RNA polymerase II transcription factor B subunit 3 [Spathaspora sp. JA1]